MKPSSPSATARIIAAATVLLAHDPVQAHLVAPGAAEWSSRFLSTTATDRLLLRTVCHRVGRRIWRWVESATLPGIMQHWWIRKRWIERTCRAALADGFGQVLVLGAGLDTLALRLCGEKDLARVGFIEADHPATQALKQNVLRQELPPNLRLLSHDFLSGDLCGALSSGPDAPFAAGVDTIVMAEGVLMYLPPAVVDRLLGSLRSLPCARLRLALSYMEKVPEAPPGFRPRSGVVNAWLKKRREPFCWFAGSDELRAMLHANGFVLDQIVTPQQFDPCMQRPTLAGENGAIAHRENAL